MRPRVVITGLGAVTPLGVGAESLHKRWADGECGIVDGAAPCSDFKPADFLSTREVRRSDRFTQLAVGAATEAYEQAGWSPDIPYDPERVGCVVGTGIGGIQTFETEHNNMLDRGPERMSPIGIPLMMTNAAAAMVAIHHGLMGPVYGVVSACAAGAHAIGDAVRMIQVGDADAVLAAGAEATLTDFTQAAFKQMGAISPLGIARPFDVRRDGFVLGEGAGAMVLESAETAAARGATILGEVNGYGTTADAHHLTAPPEGGPGATRAIRIALNDAGMTPDDIAYVNAHGTSTPLNDRAETAALKSALGERAYSIPTSSTKSTIGHLLGAAGAVEGVALILALRDRVAPPTLGYEQPEEGLDLDYVKGSSRQIAAANGTGRMVGLSNSFGFGGHNVVLCMSTS